MRAGEIVGIAGVDGNGQSELCRAMMHLLPVAHGKVLVNDQDVTNASVARHRSAGLSYVPADRRATGSVLALSIADNSILGLQRQNTRGPFLDRAKIRAHARMLATRFGVRSAGIGTVARKLSGGNLQKLVLGREILRGDACMIVEQPTRGLDAGAVAAVWQELLHERERGTALLLISAELEELMNLADRIAVMFEGRIVGVVDTDTTSAEELGRMMSGARSHAAGELHA